jgi:N-acetylglutamate synthase-like GNAT family acetyltransferase
MNKEKIVTMQLLNQIHMEDLLSLATIVGWDYDKQEIRTLLASGTVFGHVNDKRTVISCAAIIPYGSNLASIGMVIVHPDYRGIGLAKELLVTCMNQVSKDSALMLIATREGRPVYEKLGFNDYSHVTKLLGEGQQCRQSLNGYTISPYQSKDFKEMLKLDKEAFGCERDLFLKNRLEQAKEVIVIKKSNLIVGYAAAVKKPANLVIGPVVAQNDEQAMLLIQTIISNNRGMIRMDVVEGKKEIIKALVELDFQEKDRPPVMVKNSEAFPERNGSLYAIAAQSYG